MKEVVLYTDGACSGNPGPGGWGAILCYGKHRRELCGGFSNTTNNRMELIAVISGLEALKEPCSVTVVTDSQYVVNAISKGWARKWRSNGWRRSNKEPASNADLWERLLSLCDKHCVKFKWIRGHTGHPLNQRCDDLAVRATQRPDNPPDLHLIN